MAWDNNRPTHVPTRVREQALARDGYQCTATRQDGTRCTETTQLEAAHLERWTPGETPTADLVRTLCHWHHNRETQRQAQAAKKPKPSHLRPTETHPALRGPRG